VFPALAAFPASPALEELVLPVAIALAEAVTGARALLLSPLLPVGLAVAAVAVAVVVC